MEWKARTVGVEDAVCGGNGGGADEKIEDGDGGLVHVLAMTQIACHTAQG
jgi:hypothetical protein